MFEKVLKEIEDLSIDHGIELILEVLVKHIDNQIVSAQKFGDEDDYLFVLKGNLERALKDYENRYVNRIGE